MIYLKRFWNVLVVIFAVIMGLICVPLMLIEMTIVKFVYYVATGKDYTEEYESTSYYVVSLIIEIFTFDID